MLRRERNSIYMLWSYLFLGSFLLGILTMNLGSDMFLLENGIFSTASISRLKYIELDCSRFFVYVLKRRMGEGIALVILSTTGIGLISVYACVIWQGILTGMIITASIMRFGLKGLLLILGGLFPHQLLLIPAEIMLLGWCYENCSGGHLKGRYLSAYYKGKQQLVRQGMLLLWIGVVILIGCILESYVNPILISDLTKIF